VSVERVTLDEFNSIPSRRVGLSSPEDGVALLDEQGLSERSERPRTTPDSAGLSLNAPRTADPKPLREPPRLAFEADILARFGRDVRRAGVAGEQRPAKITYLALTSRVLPWGKPTNRPVSAIAKGTSSSGKSHTQQTVLRFFPEQAYFDLGSMSKRFLLYTEESLEHRFLIVPEWAVIAKDEEIVAALRTLLSEGRLIHGTVDGDRKRQARRIEKAGPTGLLMTTTAASVDPELETRCLAFLTDDSPEQTRSVFQALAALEAEDEPDVAFEEWQELQRWIADCGEHRVEIPYVAALAELMPNGVTRLRRDFVSLLCLVRAHAVLHQCTRSRNDQGRIVAAVADYQAVRGLIGELIAEGVEASVPPAIRETVEAVRRLTAQERPTAIKLIADELRIGMAATYDRVSRALTSGYLLDLAKANEKTKKIALGFALPGETQFLPSPEAVLRWLSDHRSENEDRATIPDFDGFSGSRISPKTPEAAVNDEPLSGEREAILDLAVRGFTTDQIADEFDLDIDYVTAVLSPRSE